MYLVDTNIWLERLLEQERNEEVAKFLNLIPTEKLFITDFSFHSISIILTKLRKFKILTTFIHDVFIKGEVSLISLAPKDVLEIIPVMDKFKLDFDDAYQYVAAEKYDLIIVSFDEDFDITERGRKTPIEILKLE
ncbi:VapC toxin family PIN domain ribonuclease [Candidatus Pacearchaeota archaeon]|nr:MAG: VapC toxin family PIN domain ribonuclease [Candidatus Pacearchaeota archaeon]